MPAVRNFAIYAAGAVILNAALQVTIFVSAMAIDLRRIEVSRFVILRRLKADVYPPLSPTASIGALSSLSL